MQRVGIGVASKRDPTKAIEARNQGDTVGGWFPCGYACGGDCDCNYCELYPQPLGDYSMPEGIYSSLNGI